jgi:chromosome segregation ATPase
MTMMQYHTAAEALEAATSELAKAKASITELKAKGSALMDELGDAQRNAAQAEAARDAFHADIAGLRIAYDDLQAELAEARAEREQFRECYKHEVLKVQLEFAPALEQQRTRAERAEAELATVRAATKAQSATVLQMSEAQVALQDELATVRGALEDIREWVAYRKDYSVICRELTERLNAALTATPPRRTPDATEGEGDA